MLHLRRNALVSRKPKVSWNKSQRAWKYWAYGRMIKYFYIHIIVSFFLLCYGVYWQPAVSSQLHHQLPLWVVRMNLRYHEGPQYWRKVANINRAGISTEEFWREACPGRPRPDLSSSESDFSSCSESGSTLLILWPGGGYKCAFIPIDTFVDRHMASSGGGPVMGLEKK